MRIFLIWILVMLGSTSALKTSDDEDEYEEDGSGINLRGDELSQFEDKCPYDGFKGRCGDKCAEFLRSHLDQLPPRHWAHGLLQLLHPQ